MRLVIGGAYQGKRAYALAQTGAAPEEIAEGASCALELTSETKLLCGLHRLVWRWMEAGLDPLEQAETLLLRCPDLVIVTDEVGCGVVPLDRFERDWRESTGRVCCKLAARADRVERVVCGIATTIKGESVCG